MAEKIKIVLKKQNKHLVNNLLRQFRQAVAETKSNYTLQYSDVLEILYAMKYLSWEKEEKDYELVSTIVHMLDFPKGSALVSQRNLFHFLACLNDLQGNFDCFFPNQSQIPYFTKRKSLAPLVKVQIGEFNGGKWTFSKEDEKQLRIIFSSMLYTNKSRKDTMDKDYQAKKLTFQPTILSRSANLASTRFKSLGCEEIVFDRLFEADKTIKDKIDEQRAQIQQNELNQCTFRPNLTLSSKKHKRVRSSSIDYSSYLFARGRENKLKLKMHQEEYMKHKQSLQLSGCSFKPDLSLSRNSLKNSVRRQWGVEVKGIDRSIDRVRKSRNQRIGVYEATRRGYPKVESWTQFLQEVRNSRCRKTQEDSSPQKKAVLLTITLKILGSKKYLQVKQGDNLAKMTERICKANKIKQENYSKVRRIIEQTLIGSQLIEIKKGVIEKKRR